MSDLPILDHPAARSALSSLSQGRPAHLVVEDPAPFANKRFRLIQEEGSDEVSLGEAEGPYQDLMELPGHVIQSMPTEQCKAFARASHLFVIPLVSAVRLEEHVPDDEDELDGFLAQMNAASEAGFHSHRLDREKKTTQEDGEHRHLWIVDGERVLSEVDGAHAHEISEDGETAEPEREHTHVVKIGDRTLRSGPGTPHGHALMVLISGNDGPHVHGLEIGEGEAIPSLTAGQFARLPAPGEATPPV